MKLFVITSFLFLTIASSATAQNFQPFRNKYKYQFTYTGYISNHTNSSLIHGIEIDSAKLINSDSVFYFNKLSFDPSVENSTYDNFWGNSMVKKTNGDYLFLINNNQKDTVLVKTQLSLGSQWTFKLNNLLYTVTYDHYNPETVLTNQTDFVQTYIVENTSGFKDSIKLSENFGLVYSFPFFSNETYSPEKNFNLTYIFNSKLGENKFDYFEYFNYELGDLLEYIPDIHTKGYPGKIPADIYKVISKTVSLNSDIVTYLFSVCHIDDINAVNYSVTHSHCTLIVTAYSVSGTFPYIDLLSFPRKNMFFAIAPNVDGMIITSVHPFEHDKSYAFERGLGLKNYYRDSGMDYNFEYYINRGYSNQSNTDDNCEGLETILDTKTLHASSANLVVAPNPFDHTFSLNATDLKPGSWTLRIVSALGVEVYTSAMVISSSNQQIDLANLTALHSGIYFLSLENESQVYSQKIVKK